MSKQSEKDIQLMRLVQLVERNVIRLDKRMFDRAARMTAPRLKLMLDEFTQKEKNDV